MGIFTSPIADTVMLVTGIINGVTVLLLFFTCRFVPRFKLTGSLIHKSWYRPLYKYHTYIWWVLLPSVIVHVIFTVSHILSGG